MQRPFPRLVTIGLLAGGVGVLAGLAGCGGNGPPPPRAGAGGPAFSGVALTVACPDPAFAREFKSRADAWAARTGAAVRIEPKGPAGVPTADLAIVPAPEVGGLAAAGRLAQLPASYRAGNNPLQWDRILGVYRDNLAGWAGAAVGLPVAGDGYVLAYRTDRLPDPPVTWEEVADRLAGPGKPPGLPPLPASPGRLLQLFHQIAACYDRKAVADADKGKGGAVATEQGNALHIRHGAWTPRLDTPGFAAAAKWLADTRPLRPPEPSDDQLAALTTGSAAVAVLTLAEVGALPKDPATGAVDKRFGVAPLPGSRTYFDAQGQPHAAVGRGNYVPYLGAGGKIGVVFAGSPHPDAAWNLLADLAGVVGSTALLSDPASGVGPFRTEHVGEDRDDLWLSFRFDADRTRDLGRAVRQYVSQTAVNPAVPLRTPDQAELMTALEAEVRKAATGQTPPEEAMKRAQAAWQQHDARNPDQVATWRRNAVGIP